MKQVGAQNRQLKKLRKGIILPVKLGRVYGGAETRLAVLVWGIQLKWKRKFKKDWLYRMLYMC